VPLSEARAALDHATLGDELHDLLKQLFPIHRSITGPGVRQTLKVIGEHIPLQVHEVPSGTPVLDWTVPQEWTVRAAYLEDSAGRRVLDIDHCNLHLVGYSVAVDEVLSREALEEHLHSLPERPDAIPFRTAFYSPTWGFCLSQSQRDALTDERYRVVIDSSLADGSLTYAECLLPGRTSDEVLLTTHICHPSLANDNLSGVVVLTAVGRVLAELDLRYSYRLLFNPVTIGSITWLAEHIEDVRRVRHGLVIAGVGDSGVFTYKRSRRGAADIDRAVAHVLASRGDDHLVEDFSPYGYDERQFCSPGFDLPVGCISRTPHGRYPEYHTSDDDPDFVEPAQLAGAVDLILEIIAAVEADTTYRNLAPWGEPQLGRRGLYKNMGGHADAQQHQMALLWVLNHSDGRHSMLDIAERSSLPVEALARAAQDLLSANLLEPVTDGT
jgi:aminopeptidase-like protein